MAGTTRTFIALDPPELVRSEVAAWAREFGGGVRGLRPVPARNSHITLAFLGELDPAGIELAAGALEQTAGLVGGLSLGAPVWLPRRRPRSLALEIHDNRSELADLQSSIAGRLDEAIDWREARPFRAHLTAARLGRGFVREDLVLPVSPALDFEADSITLYASRLLPEGAEYEVIEHVAFD